MALPAACGMPRVLYHRALTMAVSTAEKSHEMKYYEFTAVCARRIAEMYVGLAAQGKEYWGLYDGMWKLPYDTPMDTPRLRERRGGLMMHGRVKTEARQSLVFHE